MPSTRTRTSQAGRRPGWPAHLAALGLATALTGTVPVLGRAAEPAPAPLPKHALRMLDGSSMTLADLRGEVVVVNFWASWCRPCRSELPALDALNKELAAKGGHVVAISIDHDLDNVRRFARTHGLSLPIAHDGPDGLARELDLKAVPFTIVLDRSGAVAYTTTGTDAAAIAHVGDLTRKLMGRAPLAQGETP